MPDGERTAPAQTRRRTQTERRQATRERLLEAATELISEKGITATSLAEIGRRAGYSHAIVNHNLGSKAELVEVVILEVERQFGRRLAELGEPASGLDAILELAEAYVDLVTEAHSSSRASVVLWAEAVVQPGLRTGRALADRQIRARIADYLRTGIADGTIRPVEPDDTAVVVLGLLRGVLLQSALDPSLATRQQLKTSLRTSLGTMLGSDAPR